MQSKTSLLNKVLLKTFTNSIFWLTIGYLLLTILSLPLPLYIASVGSFIGDGEYNYNPLFWYGIVHFLFSLVYAMMLAVNIFNFKNKAETNDYIHSLPIKRTTIFSSGIFVGIIAIIVPALITSVILLLEQPVLTYNLSVQHIIIWVSFVIFAQILMFFLSVLAGMFVNSITLHIEMILILLFLPFLLWLSIVFNASTFFDGLAIYSRFGFTELIKTVGETSLMVYLFETFTSYYFPKGKMIIWTVIGIVMLILASVLYKVRKNERVNKPFNFPVIYYVLVVLLTLLGTLFLSSAISFILPEIKNLSFMIILLSAVVSYVFVLMFMQDTVRIKFRMRELIITIVSMAVFFVGFFVLWGRYVSYLPDESQIEGVYFNNGTAINNTHIEDLDILDSKYMFDDDKETIKDVRNLHKEIIDSNQKADVNNSLYTVNISYLLKNGKVVTREYNQIDANSRLGKEILNSKIPSFTKDKDLLYKIKEDKLKSFQNMNIGSYNFSHQDISLKEFRVFAKDYKNKMPEFSKKDTIFTETGVINVDIYSADNYNGYSGASTLYNPALQQFLKNKGFNFEDYNYNSLIEIDLNGVDDKHQLFEDLSTISYKEFKKKYNVKELDESEKEEKINEFNDFNFNPEGNTLYIFTDVPYDDNDVIPYIEMSVVLD